MTFVTGGMGLPNAPFVTRALGKAINQAFPARSGMSRLLLYKLQEEHLNKVNEKAAVATVVQKEEAVVVQRPAKRKVSRKAVRREVVEHSLVPMLASAVTRLDYRLAQLTARLSNMLEATLAESYAATVTPVIDFVKKRRSTDDDAAVLLLCC